MNIFLWVLQVLLAVHTFIGAMWKSVNSEQSVASLKAMPHAVWLTLLVVELFCCVGLVLPAFFKNPARRLVPVAAACIVAEMLLFCALQAFSGMRESSQLIYWLVVAAISGFIVYGRAVLRPL